MGFYHPATIVKDAQRHGLKVLPIDVTRSDWLCTLESASTDVILSEPSVLRNKAEGESKDPYLLKTSCKETYALRLGLRYVRGLRKEAGKALVRERHFAPFVSIHDLVHRVPELRKDELVTLAEIGAVNSIADALSNTKQFQIEDFRLQIETPSANKSAIRNQKSEIMSSRLGGGIAFHRRDALWQVERAVRVSGPLLEELPEPDSSSPLKPMDHEERLIADFHGTGLTVGPHPMAYRRAEMKKMGIRLACELSRIPNGKHVRIGGCVIARQRPGTAHGFVFLSLEDETGIANAIVTPDLLQKNRMLVTSERFLLIEGILQNQDNVISVKAERVLPLSVTGAETTSHDFH